MTGRSNIAKSLERKYASILGEIVAAPDSDKADGHKEALAAIQIVIRLWEPDWLPDHIKPIRPKQSYTTHGIQSRLLREFVRTSTGEFSAMDAASYLQGRLLALGETPPPLENLRSSAHQLFRKLEENYLTSLGRRPEIWSKTNNYEH